MRVVSRFLLRPQTTEEPTAMEVVKFNCGIRQMWFPSVELHPVEEIDLSVFTEEELEHFMTALKELMTSIEKIIKKRSSKAMARSG